MYPGQSHLLCVSITGSQWSFPSTVDMKDMVCVNISCDNLLSLIIKLHGSGLHVVTTTNSVSVVLVHTYIPTPLHYGR